jgi:hypothetical protein
MLILNRDAGERTRRDFLKLTSAGVLTASVSGWLGALAGRAADPTVAPAVKPRRGKAKACILLWMNGGPSHKDTFDLKPDSEGAGEFKPIDTSARGVQISEHFPKLARHMHLGTIVRSMSTGEGAHGRAQYFMHTGYKEGVGGLAYPALGALVSAEKGKTDAALPNFVAINGRSNGLGSGFLGARHAPLFVGDPAKGVEDIKPAVADGQFAKRVGLLEEMEAGFYARQQALPGKDHRLTYERAVRLMQSKEAQAFDLSRESEKSREPYGTSKFGEGCLLARRLVEAGIPFVEVVLNGWDTHENNFARVKDLSGQVDAGMSALVADLKQRGLLDSTLVVWMGDFGRTPKINSRGGDKPGRDHYPRAWSLVMMGGGVPGGLVVGRTDKQGATVEERPVSAVDFMATTCSLLGIDATKKNDTAIGRPVGVVDKGAKVITEIVGG